MNRNAINPEITATRSVAAWRQLLIGVLVLLQFTMPFLHAHAGYDASPAGLHIPGLEAYAQLDQHPAMHGSTRNQFFTEGMIVSVGSALQSVDQQLAEQDDESFQAICCAATTALLSHTPGDFFPQSLPTVDSYPAYPSAPPRAPPFC